MSIVVKSVMHTYNVYMYMHVCMVYTPEVNLAERGHTYTDSCKHTNMFVHVHVANLLGDHILKLCFVKPYIHCTHVHVGSPSLRPPLSSSHPHLPSLPPLPPYFKLTTGPTSERTALSCSSVVSNEMLATEITHTYVTNTTALHIS